MAREVKEIASAAQFQRTAEDGRVADSGTRGFKILLEFPGEIVDLQRECGVYIGSPHPFNTNIYCSSFEARYDGESRMVIVCTFQYGSTPSSDSSQQDGRERPPDIRPANWSVSSSLTEVPAMLWRPAVNHPALGSTWQVPANPVGDRYDGVTKVEPLVTFTVEQYEAQDPTQHVLLSGMVNLRPFKIGSFIGPERTVMFRGVQTQAVVEAWRDRIFRGWKATYEFVYKKNFAGDSLGDIGWDIALPQTGFNVKAFVPPGGGNDDPFGQPLKHADGKIGFEGGVPFLPIGINSGDKVRAMVKVFEYENGGASQLPSAQPIPLNDNGRPRKDTASPKVLLYRYQVQPSYDFALFNLRLT